MRQKCTVQGSIFDLYAEHEIGRELKAMSDWLDEHPEILDWIAPDLCRAESNRPGVKGCQSSRSCVAPFLNSTVSSARRHMPFIWRTPIPFKPSDGCLSG